MFDDFEMTCSYLCLGVFLMLIVGLIVMAIINTHNSDRE